MAKTNYQVTFNGKVVDIRKRDRIYNRTGQRLDLLGGQCPRWVKRRNTRYEQMYSALLPKADVAQRGRLSVSYQILTSYPCTRSVASSYTLANGVAFFGCIFCLR